MKRKMLKLPAFVILLLSITSITTPLYAQNMKTPLDKKEQKIATIAAETATGNLGALRTELNEGLEAGLTVNQIKEILVQMYAYAGFPRSLQGLNTFMEILYERKSKGITDQSGPEASPIKDTRDKYIRGKENLEKLTRRRETAPSGANAFAPAIDTFLKEHLFADIFERDVLTYRERELATISALAAMKGVEPMLQSHLGMGLNTGLTEDQLKQVLSLIGQSAGPEQEKNGLEQLRRVMENRK